MTIIFFLSKMSHLALLFSETIEQNDFVFGIQLKICLKVIMSDPNPITGYHYSKFNQICVTYSQ